MENKVTEGMKLSSESPNTIIDSIRKTQYEIGSKVSLCNGDKGQYIVYAITYYYGGRKKYTLWRSDGDYNDFEDWQIKPFEQQTIGINTTTE